MSSAFFGGRIHNAFFVFLRQRRHFGFQIGRAMGFHYEDAPSRWRRCSPLPTEASQGFRLEMKRAPLGHCLPKAKIAPNRAAGKASIYDYE
jgi:hypothetical protein